MADLTSLAGADTSALMAILGAYLAGIAIFAIVLYVFLSLAFMAIGKKAKVRTPALAWVPFVGPSIVSYKASGMHWWPWLLLIGIVIPIVGYVAMVVFGVFSMIWMWKTFEKIGRPGWWAIVGLGGMIPLIGILFSIASLVLIGIAAWAKK